jgi:hypothetical protein
VRGTGGKIGADLLKDIEQAVGRYSEQPLAGAAS